MEALVRAGLPGRIAAVVSNRPDAAGLGFAAENGIPTAVVDHQRYPSRDAFDAALADPLERQKPDLLAHAGFTRILGGESVRRFQGRMLNIHPSLLPAFQG